MEKKIIIVVRGGIVQEVRTNSAEKIEVEILDYDNIEDDPEANAEEVKALEEELETMTVIL